MKVSCFCSALLILLCSSAFAAQPEQEYKFGLAMSEEHHLVIGAKKFSELLSEYTDGRLVSHVFTGGQIASGERELVEGLQFGTVDITLVASSVLAAYDDHFQMLSLHYLFRDEDHAYKTMDGPIGKAFAEFIAKDTNITLIGWTMSGMHTMTNSKRPINSLADLKGLKLRCMESPIIADSWRAYGAVPTPMSVGEAFTAMQQGTVDGQENGTANSYANKYYEVQKYLGMTNHMVSFATLLMAKDKYEAIPADLKPAFERAVVDAIAFQRGEYARQNAAAIENFKAQGMEVSSPDLDEFRKASAPVREAFVKKMEPQVAQWIEDIETKY